jgi:hypothetical protein
MKKTRPLEHPNIVMAGLDPAIHVFGSGRQTWMPATSAGMTKEAETTMATKKAPVETGA